MQNLKKELEQFKNQYSPNILEDFWLYWAEPDRNNVPKYKKQKTWHTGMRLRKWQKNDSKWQYEKEQRQQLKFVEEKPVQDRNRSQSNLTKIDFKKYE